MNTVERYFVKQLMEREVTQGYDHTKNIRDLFRMICRAAREEFTEDNKPTLDAFLREQFESALADE